jgi:hypothetical protein
MKKSGPNEKVKNKHDFHKKGLKKALKQWWQNYQWWLMLLGVIAVFILGYIGFLKAGKTLFTDILYRIFQLFVLSFDATITLNLELELARWLAPAIAAYTAAKALVVIFREQFQLLKLRFLRNHIIICGLGNKGLLLSLKFKDYGYNIVAIELDEENDNIKECRDINITVLIGNAAAPYILRRVGLNRAKSLFSLCGQDSINVEVAVQVRKLLISKRDKPLTCVVHITDPKLCRLIKEREFETEKKDDFRLEFFNLFDQAVKSMTSTFPPFDYKKESHSSVPHLLIVGAGKMGESLLVHTAKKWMDLPGRNNEKIKISIIDKEAEKKQKLFYLRYPRLKEICEIIPREMDIESPQFEEGKFLFSNSGECNLTIIYICLDNDSFALSTALTLYQRLRLYDIPIVVRMNSETGIAQLLQGESHGLGRLHGFGLLDRVLDPELMLMGTHEILARAIHEEYLNAQFEKGETLESNPSLVSWDELPETLKDSNRRQADFLGVKLGVIGCYIIPMTDWNAEPIEFNSEEIEKMAKMEHEDWVEERQKDGWKYTPGPKDIKKKKISSLIPWEELSEEEKEKDRNPVRNIPGFLAKAGFQIYRREKRGQDI